MRFDIPFLSMFLAMVRGVHFFSMLRGSGSVMIPFPFCLVWTGMPMMSCVNLLIEALPRIVIYEFVPSSSDE